MKAYQVFNPELDFLKAFNIVGKSFSYSEVNLPATYIVDKQIKGGGFLRWLIALGDNWFISIANFIGQYDSTFQKILLTYNDSVCDQFNRCHAIYCDEDDLKKNGGTNLAFYVDEVIATLIHHRISYTEKTCQACRGESPLQTHYIQLL